MEHLEWMLGSAEPGSSLHQLLVVAAPAAAVGPFGIPDPEQLRVHLYAIAADVTVEPVDQFVAKTIATAAADHAGNSEVVLFAAFRQEAWAIKPMDDLGRQLIKEGRLFDHPHVMDAAFVYAACRDGRRWRGRRWLTGPNAGETEDVDLLVGRPIPGEGAGVAVAPLIRKLVGISSMV